MQDNDIDPETLKPIVIYKGDARFYWAEYNEGPWEYARVYGLNHPVLGETDIRTSQVLRKFDWGFETRNTIYRQEGS
jgi:hypothetical protein